MLTAICPRSCDPFYIVTYYIKLVTYTSIGHTVQIEKPPWANTKYKNIIVNKNALYSRLYTLDLINDVLYVQKIWPNLDSN